MLGLYTNWATTRQVSSRLNSGLLYLHLLNELFTVSNTLSAAANAYVLLSAFMSFSNRHSGCERGILRIASWQYSYYDTTTFTKKLVVEVNVVPMPAYDSRETIEGRIVIVIGNESGNLNGMWIFSMCILLSTHADTWEHNQVLPCDLLDSVMCCHISDEKSMKLDSCPHYNDVIMRAMASQITSGAIVYSTVYSGAKQRIYQSFVSLAFVWGIRRWPVNSPYKGPVTRKMVPFDDVIMSLSHTKLFFIRALISDYIYNGNHRQSIFSWNVSLISMIQT